MKTTSEGDIFYYIIGVLFGIGLAYFANQTYGNLISFHANHMAKNTEFYNSVSGADRWITLNQRRETLILLISIGLSILSAHATLLRKQIKPKQTNPALIFGKYVGILFVAGLLSWIIGAVSASVIYPLPSAYSATESQIAFRHDQLAVWITALGPAPILVTTIGVDYRRTLSQLKSDQHDEYISLKKEYEQITVEFAGINDISWPFIQNDEFADIESTKRREEILNSLNHDIDALRSLIKDLEAVREDYSELDTVDQSEHLDGVVKRTHQVVVNGLTDEVDDVHAKIDRKERHIQRVRRRNKITSSLDDCNNTFVIEQIKSGLDIINLRKSESEQILVRCELYLESLSKIQNIKQDYSDINADGLYSLLQSTNIHNSNSSIDVEDLSTLVDQTLQIAIFLDNHNLDNTEVVASEFIQSVNNAIRTQSIEAITNKYNHIESLRGEIWDIETLRSMDWDTFEHVLGDLWAAEGYETTVTQGSADEGIDIIAENGTERVAIQAKRYAANNTVGNRTVRNTAGVLPRGFDQVIVVTTSSFTQPALDEARKYGDQVLLLNGVQTVQKLNQSGLVPPKKPTSSEYRHRAGE